MAGRNEHQLDVPGHDVFQRRGRALVVHRDEVHAGDGLEHFHIEIAARADAVVAVIQLTGLGLAERDQVLDALRRHRRIER
jgi:hypothetical protein